MKRWQVGSLAVTALIIAILLVVNRHQVDWGNVPAYLSGIGVVVIGALGLNTWRRQLQGSHDFDLARRVLRAVYSLRDNVTLVRDPFMYAYEAADRPEDDTAPWQAFAYQRRWDRVTASFQELDVGLVEVEVVWGDLLKSEADALRRHVQKLSIATRDLLRHEAKEPDVSAPTREDQATLYYGIDGDAFGAELDRLVGEFAQKLRPKLQRGARM